MKHIKLYEVLGLVVILALTVVAGVSCANASDTGIYGVTWVLQSYRQPGDQTPTVAVEDKETTLTFDKDKMTVSGNGGVNGYGGDFTVEGNDLTFSRMLHTLMAGSGPIMIQENAFFSIMDSATSYEIDGNQLTITGTGGNLVFLNK
jgi:heat shock protein HslJ